MAALSQLTGKDLLPSVEHETEMLDRMAEMGIVDGTTGEAIPARGRLQRRGKRSGVGAAAPGRGVRAASYDSTHQKTRLPVRTTRAVVPDHAAYVLVIPDHAA